MKTFMKTFVGLAVATLALAAATPSHARDYKYCLYQDLMDGGDCSFVSYEQCRASASGCRMPDQPAPGLRKPTETSKVKERGAAPLSIRRGPFARTLTARINA